MRVSARSAERTVSGLKRRLDDVVAAADAATAELDAAKRAREAAETELRGSQTQASIAAATIQALEVSPRLPPSPRIGEPCLRFLLPDFDSTYYFGACRRRSRISRRRSRRWAPSWRSLRSEISKTAAHH
jgi:hypothetical protein